MFNSSYQPEELMQYIAEWADTDQEDRPNLLVPRPEPEAETKEDLEQMKSELHELLKEPALTEE